MKTNICMGVAAIALIASATVATASPRFDLFVSEDDGRKTVAVSETDGEAFAVAAGKRGALGLLPADAARSALEDLRARGPLDKTIVIEDDETEGDAHKTVIIEKTGAADGAAQKHKRHIMIVTSDREDAEEETVTIKGQDEGDEDIRVEDKQIIIKRIDRDGKRPADIDRLLDGEHLTIETTDDGDSKKKFVRISGADADAAAKFIDDIDGLDRREKKDMKAALGI